MKFFLYAIFFLNSPLLWASTSFPIDLTGEAYYYIDYRKTFDNNSIINVEDFLWKKINSQKISLGYLAYPVWIRVSLPKTIVDQDVLYLEADYAQTNEINLVAYAKNKVVNQFQLGANWPYDAREINYPSYVFPLKNLKNEEQKIYIQFKSDNPVQSKLLLWDANSFYSFKQKQMSFYGVYYGFLFVMLFYNIFLYYSLRDRNYLYFFSFIGPLIFMQMTYDGLSYSLLWPNSVRWNNNCALWFLALSNCFLCFFIIEFFSLNDKSIKMKKLFLLLSSISLAYILISFFISIHALSVLLTLHTMLITSIGMGVSLRFLYLKRKEALSFFMLYYSIVVVPEFFPLPSKII